MRSSAFETKPCLSRAVWQALPVRRRLPLLSHLPCPIDSNVVPLMYLILELSSAHEKRDVLTRPKCSKDFGRNFSTLLGRRDTLYPRKLMCPQCSVLKHVRSSELQPQNATAHELEISPLFLLGKLWGNGLISLNFPNGKWKFPFPLNFP